MQGQPRKSWFHLLCSGKLCDCVVVAMAAGAEEGVYNNSDKGEASKLLLRAGGKLNYEWICISVQLQVQIVVIIVIVYRNLWIAVVIMYEPYFVHTQTHVHVPHIILIKHTDRKHKYIYTYI